MADYSIKHKNSSEYNTSNWSGGTTTELGIGPEGSRYAPEEMARIRFNANGKPKAK